uniref:BMC domain-containing protein n=1 Tax=Proteiniclasticum sp. TaxID=2053595 RepID=UPI00289814A8
LLLVSMGERRREALSKGAAFRIMYISDRKGRGARKNSIRLLEFKSIAKGIEVTDALMKGSRVELVLSNAICPGKYITLVTGDLTQVKNAVELGRRLGGIFLIELELIANVHPEILPALSGTAEIDDIDCIGVIETMSCLNSIVTADIARKAANVRLVEVRIARGLGGKGFTILSGEVSAVKRAIEAVHDKFLPMGDILCSTVLSNANKELVRKLFT